MKLFGVNANVPAELGNFRRLSSLVLDMSVQAQASHAPSPLQTLAVAAVAAAGMLFWGSWKFMISTNALENYVAQHRSSRYQPQHAIPVGGDVLDGVYHSSGAERDSQPHPLTTLSRCSDSLPKAGTITSSTLRMSSKL